MNKQKAAKTAAAALMAVFIAYTVWKWPHWRASSEAASAYAARITCSCRFVEGRSAESCAQDVGEFAGFVSITESADEKAIIGSVPLLGRAKAGFAPGYGCLMQPE